MGIISVAPSANRILVTFAVLPSTTPSATASHPLFLVLEFLLHKPAHNVQVEIALVSLIEHKWITLDDIGLKFKVAIEARGQTHWDWDG